MLNIVEKGRDRLVWLAKSEIKYEISSFIFHLAQSDANLFRGIVCRNDHYGILKVR